MKRLPLRNRMIALLLLAAFVCQPLPPRSVSAQQGDDTYLPEVKSPAGPPQVAIVAPYAHSSVSGVIVFAAVAASPSPIERVQFRAGDTLLGEDADATDGFSILVDSRNLPTGTLTLSAIATGPGGQGSDDVIVYVVPDPASSGVTTANGAGVFATETGSVITLRPGAALPGSAVVVDELTQDEVAQQHHIDWPSMGVTFLSAQEISSLSPITLPLAGVTSVNFANRIQPGQVAFNYRLQPDADGDGASEIVVVNTAVLAPSGEVVANAAGRPLILSGDGVPGAAALSGPPGFLIEIPVRGFNLFAEAANRAIFTTPTAQIEAFGSVYVDPLRPAQQIFRVMIPNLPPGEATLILHNASLADATDPIAVTIEPLPTLTQSADLVLAELFAAYIQAVNQKVATLPTFSAPDHLAAVTQAAHNLTAHLAALKSAYANIGHTLAAASLPESAAAPPVVDEIRRGMNTTATIIEVNRKSGVANLRAPASSACRQPFAVDDPFDFLADLVTGLTAWPVVDANPVGITSPVATSAVATLTETQAATTAAHAHFRNVMRGLVYSNLQTVGACQTEIPPPPCPPGQVSSGPTGMGAVWSPGGNGCGSVTGIDSHNLSERVVVKIYVQGNAMPFSGLTDAGGYFFVPFIPEGESFVAIAYDRVGGETRSDSGTGPRTGDSVLLAFDFSVPDEATIRWDGGGDGASWADARNWDADRLPVDGDRVHIDAAPAGAVARTVIVSGDVEIASLHSDAALVVDGGNLLVRASSTVNNSFTLAPESSLRAEGMTARFTVSGTTVLSGTVWAFNGGQVILPHARLIDGNSDDYAHITAVGEGSLVDLSGVRTILGNTRTGFFGTPFYYPIGAIDSGRVNLSALTAISSGRIQATASGSGSYIDFSSLVDLGDRSKLVADDFGRIAMPNAVDLDTVSIDLGANGLISTTQVLSLQRAHVRLTGETVTFPNVANVDGSAFEVYDGGVLTFPAVTSYRGIEDGINSEWAVQQAGSQLSFPALRTLRGNTFVNTALVVTAQDGALVDLAQVDVIDDGKVQFVAQGTGSLIDLSSLVRFARSGRGTSSFTTAQGGRILSPNLVDLEGVNLLIDNVVGVDTSQIVTFTSGGIEVDGLTADFANLAHVDGASLVVRDGGVLALPKVTSYVGDGLDFFTMLRAEGVGSVLDLSGVTQLAGNTSSFDALIVQAVDGGKVYLPGVTTIAQGRVQIEAEGSDSRIDLSSLTSFGGGSADISSMRAGAGSVIDLANVLHVEDVDITVETGGVYGLTTLRLNSGARLLGGARFAASVVNRGEVAPELTLFSSGESEEGAPASRSVSAFLGGGQLQIDGSYTQEAEGVLAIEITGPLALDYDRLAVTGRVQLGGTLSLSLLGGYDPAPGASFTILTGGSFGGVFTEITGAKIDANRRFEVSYGVQSVTVRVVGE